MTPLSPDEREAMNAVHRPTVGVSPFGDACPVDKQMWPCEQARYEVALVAAEKDRDKWKDEAEHEPDGPAS